MLVHFAEHVDSVPQNLVALELRLGPVRSPLFDLKRIPVSKILAKSIHRLAEYTIGVALLHFKWTNLVDQVVEHVAQVHGVQHAESKVDRELQSRLARGRLDSVAVLEQQHTEAIEACVLQREAILRFIHAEAAWTTRTRRKENIVVQNVFAGDTFLFQELEILHQIPHCEVRRIALPVVAVFFASLEPRHVRHRHLLPPISTPLDPPPTPP